MNIDNPLTAAVAFRIGPVDITWPVVTTWGVMAVLGVGAFLATRRLSLRPGRVQAALEMVVEVLDGEIAAAIPGDPGRFRGLIGTLLLFIACANASSLLPGVEPPTAHLETDAALAAVVLVAGLVWGIRILGLRGWLATFTHPTWVMLPLNLVEQVTRHFSLMVRLFGNVMSGVFVVGIVSALAGLLVPIPLIALDLLTGAVQAYIFATLALVFIGSAVNEAGAGDPSSTDTPEPPHG